MTNQNVQTNLMLFEEFQDCHHGYNHGILELRDLAILNLLVTPMPPFKFQRNLTY